MKSFSEPRTKAARARNILGDHDGNPAGLPRTKICFGLPRSGAHGLPVSLPPVAEHAKHPRPPTFPPPARHPLILTRWFDRRIERCHRHHDTAFIAPFKPFEGPLIVLVSPQLFVHPLLRLPLGVAVPAGPQNKRTAQR